MVFWSKRNPIKRLRRRIKEYFIFERKRHLFDFSLMSLEFDEENFKNRRRGEYYEFGAVLKSIFNPPEIMDIGCANGYLLEYFYKNGVKDIAGIEIAEAAFKYMPEEIKGKVIRTNLTSSLKDTSGDSRKYYLVNCTEVGEHIPFKYEEIFLNNVVSLVDKYLILSWADTWEGWHGIERQAHVNPRSKKYIKEKLSASGLKYNKRLTDILVRRLSERPVYEHWIKRIMVFEK